MKTLFALAAVTVALFLTAPNNIEAQKRKAARIIEGTISDYECGDNCYLTIIDKTGKQHIGLCTAPLCTKWNREVMMPDSYKGKRVKVTVGKGTQLTGSGDVVGTMAAFTRIQLLTAPLSEEVEAQKAKTVSNSLEFLRKLKDGPINNYLDKPIIKKRLQNLIGRKSLKFLYGLTLNRPNEMSDDVFVANGCMPHFCSDSNFILIIEIAKNTFHVGIRDNNRIKIYSEKNITPSSQIQRRIQEWKDESEL